jgi:hypothetical protein
MLGCGNTANRGDDTRPWMTSDAKAQSNATVEASDRGGIFPSDFVFTQEPAGLRNPP